MMTKRNSTMMAPAYTRTWMAAMKGAPRIRTIPASESIVTTSHIAAASGLRCRTQSSADPMATAPSR
jgi:hypothetical protein